MLDNYMQELLAGGGITIAGIVSAVMGWRWWNAPKTPAQGRKHLRGLIECLKACDESEDVNLSDLSLYDAGRMLTNQEMQWGVKEYDASSIRGKDSQRHGK